MFKSKEPVWRTRTSKVLDNTEQIELDTAIETEDIDELIRIYSIAFKRIGIVSDNNAERYIRRMVPEVSNHGGN
tara:strand:- start:2283 stop:2504 length:222 start_codon:yes stop_codon:yes gene_type:complete